MGFAAPVTVEMRLRLLVADDDAMLREILAEGLEEEGFEVVVARDGAEALELFRSDGPYDVLLIDEEMPRLTGRRLLELIRREAPALPALLISGNLEIDAAEQASLGVGPVLRKPVSIQELVAAIREAVGSGAAGPGRS